MLKRWRDYLWLGEQQRFYKKHSGICIGKEVGFVLAESARKEIKVG